jgi:hypothetical protein
MTGRQGQSGFILVRPGLLGVSPHRIGKNQGLPICFKKIVCQSRELLFETPL